MKILVTDKAPAQGFERAILWRQVTVHRVVDDDTLWFATRPLPHDADALKKGERDYAHALKFWNT